VSTSRTHQRLIHYISTRVEGSPRIGTESGWEPLSRSEPSTVTCHRQMRLQERSFCCWKSDCGQTAAADGLGGQSPCRKQSRRQPHHLFLCMNGCNTPAPKEICVDRDSAPSAVAVSHSRQPHLRLLDACAGVRGPARMSRRTSVPQWPRSTQAAWLTKGVTPETANLPRMTRPLLQYLSLTGGLESAGLAEKAEPGQDIRKDGSLP